MALRNRPQSVHNYSFSIASFNGRSLRNISKICHSVLVETRFGKFLAFSEKGPVMLDVLSSPRKFQTQIIVLRSADFSKKC